MDTVDHSPTAQARVALDRINQLIDEKRALINVEGPAMFRLVQRLRRGRETLVNWIAAGNPGLPPDLSALAADIPEVRSILEEATVVAAADGSDARPPSSSPIDLPAARSGPGEFGTADPSAPSAPGDLPVRPLSDSRQPSSPKGEPEPVRPAPASAEPVSPNDYLTRLEPLRGDASLNGLQLIRAYLDAAADQAEPTWRNAARALQALAERSYPAALSALVLLRTDPDPYLQDLTVAVQNQVLNWFANDLAALGKWVRATLASTAGTLDAGQYQNQQGRLQSLDECARALQEVGLLGDEQREELGSLRRTLPDLGHLAELNELRRRAEEAQRLGLVDQYRPLSDEIGRFPYSNLSGFDALQSLGQKLRIADAEIKAKDGATTSIIDSQAFEEGLENIKELAKTRSTYWDINQNKYIPMAEALSAANAKAAAYAVSQFQNKLQRAHEFEETAPAQALRILAELDAIGVVATHLPPKEKNERQQLIARLKAAAQAWDQAQELIDDSADETNLGERVRLLQRAEEVYPKHPAVREGLLAAIDSWVRETSRIVTQQLQDIEWRVAATDRNGIENLRATLQAAEAKLRELGGAGVDNRAIGELLERVASDRGQVNQHDGELAHAELLFGQIEGYLKTGATDEAEKIAQQLARLTLPPSLGAQLNQRQLVIAERRGSDQLFETIRAALAAGRREEALEGAERLIRAIPDSEPYRLLHNQAFVAYHRAAAESAYSLGKYRDAAEHYEALIQQGGALAAQLRPVHDEIEAILSRAVADREVLEAAEQLRRVGNPSAAIERLRAVMAQRGVYRGEAGRRLQEYAQSWEQDLVGRATSALSGRTNGVAGPGQVLSELQAAIDAFTTIDRPNQHLLLLSRRLAAVVRLQRIQAQRAVNLATALDLAKQTLEELSDSLGEPEYFEIQQVHEEMLREHLLDEVRLRSRAEAIAAIQAAQDRSTSLRRDAAVNFELARLLFADGRWDHCARIASLPDLLENPKARQLEQRARLQQTLNDLASRFAAETPTAELVGRVTEAARVLTPFLASDVTRSETEEALERFRRQAIEALSAAIDRVDLTATDQLETLVRRYVATAQVLRLADSASASLANLEIVARARREAPRLRQQTQAQLAQFVNNNSFSAEQLALPMIDDALTKATHAFDLADQVNRLLIDGNAVPFNLERLQRAATVLSDVKKARDLLRSSVEQTLRGDGDPELLLGQIAEVRQRLESLESQPLTSFVGIAEKMATELEKVRAARIRLLNELIPNADAETDAGRASALYEEALEHARSLRTAVQQVNLWQSQLPLGLGSPASRLNPDDLVHLVDEYFGNIDGVTNLIDLLDLRARNTRAVHEWMVKRDHGFRACRDRFDEVRGVIEDVQRAYSTPPAQRQPNHSIANLFSNLRDAVAALQEVNRDLGKFPYTTGIGVTWQRKLGIPQGDGNMPLAGRAALAAFDTVQEFHREVVELKETGEVLLQRIEAKRNELNDLKLKFEKAMRERGVVDLILQSYKEIDPKDPLYRLMYQRAYKREPPN
jgi:hypothetical protein